MAGRQRFIRRWRRSPVVSLLHGVRPDLIEELLTMSTDEKLPESVYSLLRYLAARKNDEAVVVRSLPEELRDPDLLTLGDDLGVIRLVARTRAGVASVDGPIAEWPAWVDFRRCGFGPTVDHALARDAGAESGKHLHIRITPHGRTRLAEQRLRFERKRSTPRRRGKRQGIRGPTKRQMRAIELRERHWPLSQIADELGIRSVSAVSGLISRGKAAVRYLERGSTRSIRPDRHYDEQPRDGG